MESTKKQVFLKLKGKQIINIAATEPTDCLYLMWDWYFIKIGIDNIHSFFGIPKRLGIKVSTEEYLTPIK